MKRRKLVVSFIFLALAFWVVYVNVFPPIYEIAETYSCDNWDFRQEDHRSEFYTFSRYYMIQNPPKNEDALLQLTDEYVCENDLFVNAPDAADADKAGSEYNVSLIFCKKSYSPFGINRFWHGKWDNYGIDSYGEYYLVMYHAKVQDGKAVEGDVYTNIDDHMRKVRDSLI